MNEIMQKIDSQRSVDAPRSTDPRAEKGNHTQFPIIHSASQAKLPQSSHQQQNSCEPLPGSQAKEDGLPKKAKIGLDQPKKHALGAGSNPLGASNSRPDPEIQSLGCSYAILFDPQLVQKLPKDKVANIKFSISRDFLAAINYSNNLYVYSLQERNAPIYKAYVAKGNNHMLVR